MIPTLSLLVVGVVHAEPGDHVRAGEVELAPDLDVGTEYVYNVYRSETGEIPAAHLRLAPGLLVTAGGDDHEFRGSGKWVLRTYYFVGQNEGLADESTQVGNLNRFDEFQLSLGADTFKRSMVGWRLTEDMAKQNYGADCEYCDIPFLSHYGNALATGIRVSPGAALSLVPGLRWNHDEYLIPAHEDSLRTYDIDNAFGPNLDAKWSFLPRTSLVAHVEWMYHDWRDNAITANGSTDVVPNSNVVKATTGIDGRFTEKLLMQALVGYGVGVFLDGSVPGAVGGAGPNATGVDGILAQAQLRYLVTPSERGRPGTSFTGGYTRDFRTPFFANYVAINGAFAEAHGRFGIVEPTARFEYRSEVYHGTDIATGEPYARTDNVPKLAGDLRIGSDWAAFTAGVWWQQRASSDAEVEYDMVNVHVLGTFTY